MATATTAADVLVELGVGSQWDEQRDGPALSAKLALAKAAWEKWTGKTLTASTVTKVVDGTGKPYLWLPDAPTSITSISYRIGRSDDWTNYIDEYPDGYYELTDRRVIWTGTAAGGWPCGYQNLQVVYVVGSTWPDYRHYGVTMLTAHLWRTRAVAVAPGGDTAQPQFSSIPNTIRELVAMDSVAPV